MNKNRQSVPESSFLCAAVAMCAPLLPVFALILLLFTLSACGTNLSTEEGEIRIVNIGGQEIVIGDGKIGGAPSGTVEPPVEQRVAGGGFSYMPFPGYRVVNSVNTSYMTNDDFFSDATEVTIEGYSIAADGVPHYDTIDDAAAVWLAGSEETQPPTATTIAGIPGHVLAFENHGAEEYAGRLYLVQSSEQQVMIFVKSWPITYWENDVAAQLDDLLASMRFQPPTQSE